MKTPSIVILPLLLMISNVALAWQNSTLSYFPEPLEQLIWSSTMRMPASSERITVQYDQQLDPEENYYLQHRIFYYDPKSGATCLGIEGENECLGP